MPLNFLLHSLVLQSSRKPHTHPLLIACEGVSLAQDQSHSVVFFPKLWWIIWSVVPPLRWTADTRAEVTQQPVHTSSYARTARRAGWAVAMMWKKNPCLCPAAPWQFWKGLCEHGGRQEGWWLPVSPSSSSTKFLSELGAQFAVEDKLLKSLHFVWNQSL